MIASALSQMNRPRLWRARAAIAGLMLVAVVSVIATRVLLNAQISSIFRNNAEAAIAQNSATLIAELRRQRAVTQLLAGNDGLRVAFAAQDSSGASQILERFANDIEVQSLRLLDAQGRVFASTTRSGLTPGRQSRDEAFFRSVMGKPGTQFAALPTDGTGLEFVFAQRVMEADTPRGVLVVALDLTRLEAEWAGENRSVLVMDQGGVVLLATEANWRGQALTDALPGAAPQGDVPALLPDTTVLGETMMRHRVALSENGWQMLSLTSYQGVRDKVNGVLASVVTGFALLLALVFFAVSRQSAARLTRVSQEKAGLRRVNARLQQEIAERERVQENLDVAEQSLEQSSKLAALGEMSAAVSHELNQPLAAMKTYLAGARLLLRRNRPEEALAAFGRLDQLIERMSAITRQLKSYARKGQVDLTPVNLQDALAGSLSMMSPQLREREVTILRSLPDLPVVVLGDRLRIEQVIINLLRNALDATKAVRDPLVEITLTATDVAALTIRDNGPGLADHDSLFEPFYTTKQPGDGVGLGLAISSGIVSELGGRLTARNGQSGGAVFEMQIPILNGATPVTDMSAAE